MIWICEQNSSSNEEGTIASHQNSCQWLLWRYPFNFDSWVYFTKTTARDFQGRMMIDREQHKPLWAAFQKLFMMMAESQKDIHDEENL